MRNPLRRRRSRHGRRATRRAPILEITAEDILGDLHYPAGAHTRGRARRG